MAQDNDQLGALDTEVNFGVGDLDGGLDDDLFNGLFSDDLTSVFSDFDMNITGTDNMMDNTDNQPGSPNARFGGRCSPSMNGPRKGSQAGSATDVQVCY